MMPRATCSSERSLALCSAQNERFAMIKLDSQSCLRPARGERLRAIQLDSQSRARGWPIRRDQGVRKFPSLPSFARTPNFTLSGVLRGTGPRITTAFMLAPARTPV